MVNRSGIPITGALTLVDPSFAAAGAVGATHEATAARRSAPSTPLRFPRALDAGWTGPWSAEEEEDVVAVWWRGGGGGEGEGGGAVIMVRRGGLVAADGWAWRRPASDGGAEKAGGAIPQRELCCCWGFWPCQVSLLCRV